jgi:hypothetical protein
MYRFVFLFITLIAGRANVFADMAVDRGKVSIDPTLERWVEARAGSSQPVHWVSEGAVYDYPSGKKLFGMIGFDSSRVIWPTEPDQPVQHLTRKTFTYTDAETGEVLTEYQGNPVIPIAYPYQLITYRVENGLIYADVEQGVEPNIRQIKSNDGIIARPMGESTWAYTAAVFLDFPLPSGARYEAWENYDFFIHDSDSGVDRPHQMTWQRYGDLPAWAGGGKAIYHLLSWRVDRHEDFPEQLLKWAKETKPMWLQPPADLDEIRAIQQGEDRGKNW